jgi:U3 small nucleolar RNA-associated protein 6
MNLEALRKKRSKRFGIKATPQHAGRRVLFILDRATRKCPGNLGLWVQYIEYCRRQKMYRRLTDVFSDALRLHPANADLWIYAAKYALEEHADMTQARSYFQRGLRFCKSQRNMWIQYGRLECIYIAKLFARRQILGLDQPVKDRSAPTQAIDGEEDMIALPALTAEDINPTAEKDDGLDEGALEALNSTPALTGAIPMAIFDAAMKESSSNLILAQEFFDMVFEFEGLPCLRKILEHIVTHQTTKSPSNYRVAICDIKLPVAGIKATSPEFPRALGTSLRHMKKYQIEPNLAQELVRWLRPLSENEELDPALHKVVEITLGNAQKHFPAKDSVDQ